MQTLYDDSSFFMLTDRAPRHIRSKVNLSNKKVLSFFSSFKVERELQSRFLPSSGANPINQCFISITVATVDRFPNNELLISEYSTSRLM